MGTHNRLLPVYFAFLVFAAHAQPTHFDVIIRNGMVYDGSGGQPYQADVGIRKDTIGAIGDLRDATAAYVVDATGQAVAPGFINMLSWADGTFLKDSRSLSDLKQGVTLEVFGEGISAGPRKRKAGDKRWTTLGGYFQTLEKKGVAVNFASLVGATTVRDYVLGNVNRAPSAPELAQMKKLVQVAMQEGAMGLGSSLIYAPAAFASTNELIALAEVAGRYGGIYATHLRSESDDILPALFEAFRIGYEAKIPVEIYHLKINHARNWGKIDTVLQKIDSARAAGLRVTANMYPYKASGTGLTARLPTWVQEGGITIMCQRLKSPEVRNKVLFEMRNGIPIRNSDPADVMLLGFKKDSLSRMYAGKRLDEIARLHGKDADETVIDLVMADRSSVPAMYFLISEENMKRMMGLPYVSFCSDAASVAAEKPFTNELTHPRVYGSFARVLGKYVREEQLMPLEEAIRKLTSLPADNLKIARRGRLQVGHYADVVVFDAATIRDLATYENPHQYAEGVRHVFVNGQWTLKEGTFTGALAGRCVRGPGWRKR